MNLRRVKLTLSSERAKAHKPSATFWVAEEKSIQFEETLLRFLESCAQKNGMVTVTSETVDSETRNPCGIEIEISGNIDTYARELEHYGSAMSQLSERAVRHA